MPSFPIPSMGEHIFTLGFSGTRTTDGSQVTAFDITVPTGEQITTADADFGNSLSVNDANRFTPLMVINR